MGKKKGKSKSKKSKKGSGKKAKAPGLADPATKIPTAEEKLWIKRYQISEVSRNQHRANAMTLVGENKSLTEKLYTAEKDALEVIAFFKKQRAEKEREAREIGEAMRQLKRDYGDEKVAMEAAHEERVTALEQDVALKDMELKEIRKKLDELEDWDAARDGLISELDDLKADQEAAALEYKRHIEQMEQKFNEEKLRQKKETDAEIAVLASTAHDAAVAELDKATQQSFRDVVRLTSELDINRAECQRLQKEVTTLREKCALLSSQKEEAEILARDAVGRVKQREATIASLTEKVAALETTLGHCVREFENERGLLAARTDERTADIQVQLVAAHRALKLKTAENKRIRALARKVVQQRSETEQFFAEALGETRERILEQRAEFEKAVKAQHRQQMMSGAKSGILPPIQTFGKHPHSTNSIQHRFEGANQLPDLSERVDISDMTWEQKEQVLRLLFSKMNSPREKRAYTIQVVHPNAPTALTTQRPSAIEGGSVGRSRHVSHAHDSTTSTTPLHASGGGLQGLTEEEAAFFITEGVLERDGDSVQGGGSGDTSSTRVAQDV
eukprot:m.89570 g.89570  ORF g.89570 m.89570 type:complete len:561 (-) comp9809_c1_seq1:91-1773(-)